MGSIAPSSEQQGCNGKEPNDRVNLKEDEERSEAEGDYWRLLDTDADFLELEYEIWPKDTEDGTGHVIIPS